MTSRRVILAFLILIGLGVWSSFPSEHILTGESMGTTYTVKAYVPKWVDAKSIDTEIKDALADVNSTFSTYDPNSEISKINELLTTENIPVSDSFNTLLALSKTVYHDSGWRWDPTIKPLVDLWGFSKEKHDKVPSKQDIKRVMKQIGFDKVNVSLGYIQKMQPDIQIDMSSIAKGYAVDKVARVLESKRASQFMVEIGGEVKTYGRHPNGSPWRIGINTPDPSANVTESIMIVPLAGQALATSGDYRQFKRDTSGKRLSHILHPQSGYPVETSIVSVSVVADSCAKADAYATALMLMPLEDGQRLVNAKENMDALWILDDGTLIVSKNFPKL